MSADLRCAEAVRNFNALRQRLDWGAFGIEPLDLSHPETAAGISPTLPGVAVAEPAVPLLVITDEFFGEENSLGLQTSPMLPEETDLHPFDPDPLVYEYEPSARHFHTPQSVRRQLFLVLEWRETAKRPHTHLSNFGLLSAIETTLLFASLSKLAEKEQIIAQCLQEAPDLDRDRLLDLHYWQRLRRTIETKCLLRELVYESTESLRESIENAQILLDPEYREFVTPRDAREMARLARIKAVLEE